MRVSRFVLLSLVALAVPSFAASECDEDFLECKEDCAIEYGGSIRVEQKKGLDKCMRRCTKKVNRCTERVMETKASSLDEGALDGTPTSDEVDERGMPTRTGGGDPKRAKKEAPVESDAEARDEAPAAPREALRSEEVPRSSRTTLKTEAPSEAPAKKAAPEPEAAEVEKPAPAPVIEMKMSRRKDDEDLRDDGPRTEAPKEEAAPAPPPPPKKREEKPKEPPKKRVEEDHDDLRNY